MNGPVGVTRDFLGPDGRNVWGDIALSRLDEAHVPWEYLSDYSAVLEPGQIEGRPAILLAAPAVDASTFIGVKRPPALFARFGVGYDAIDLDCCTQHDAAVTITPDGARRPVATAALCMMLATMHNVIVKDRLVRTQRWDECNQWMGTGLTGRTVGLVGLGSTATDLVSLLKPFNVRVLAYDPYCDNQRAKAVGATLTTLAGLAAESDVVVVMAVLSSETHHLIDAGFVAAMKTTAFLVNVSRGPIVDEKAVANALANDGIAGAALDVFEEEPLSANSPLVTLDKVTLSPHSIAWTDEMAMGNGTSAVQAILDTIAGKVPRFVVNRDVLESEGFRRKLSKGQ